VARLLGVRRVIAPIMAGVFCSAGMLSADAEHNFVKAILRPLEQCDATVQAAVEQLRAQGLDVLQSEGYPADSVDITAMADLRYLGQSSELTVPVTGAFGEAGTLEALGRDFNALYERTFGYSSDETLELVNVRVFAYGRSTQRLNFRTSGVDSSALHGETGERLVSFDPEGQPCLTKLLPRSAMTTQAVDGPLIIESYDTTIVVPPNTRAWADPIGNIVIELLPEAA